MGERLFRRILSGLGLARITASKDDGPTQTVQAHFGAGEIHDDRFRLCEYGFTSRPKAGADALVAFLSGDRGAGLVIATGDRRYRLRNLAEGEVALHDDLGHEIRLGRGGISIKGAGHDLTITGVPTLRIDGSIEATGDVKAGTISLKTHKHTGVQVGTAQTGTPVP